MKSLGSERDPNETRRVALNQTIRHRYWHRGTGNNHQLECQSDLRLQESQGHNHHGKVADVQ